MYRRRIVSTYVCQLVDLDHHLRFIADPTSRDRTFPRELLTATMNNFRRFAISCIDKVMGGDMQT